MNRPRLTQALPSDGSLRFSGRPHFHGWPHSLLALLLLLLANQAGVRAADSPTPSPVSITSAGIAATLQPIRERHGVPALSGAIVTSRGLLAVGVVGERKRGSAVPATTNDAWHLGSDTKAMTATLAALLVEKGRLQWTSTVAQVFPELAAGFDPACRPVTLTQLLMHRAGLPANLDWGALSHSGSVPSQRVAAVKEALGHAPRSAPGTRMEYSNVGYVVAGAMIERVTGESWERVMETRLFQPLAMTHAGFGGIGTRGRIDAPWPHRADGQPEPDNGPDIDNPPVLGPAGRVHAPLADWARFIADQLRGAQGGQGLLRPESYRTLQTAPDGGDYALGWQVTKRDWAGGRALTHTGSNTMNFSVVWMSPARDFAVLVCVNQGGDTAARAADEAAWGLIRDLGVGPHY